MEKAPVDQRVEIGEAAIDAFSMCRKAIHESGTLD
jgi:hypothetical protein